MSKKFFNKYNYNIFSILKKKLKITFIKQNLIKEYIIFISWIRKEKYWVKYKT